MTTDALPAALPADHARRLCGIRSALLIATACTVSLCGQALAKTVAETPVAAEVAAPAPAASGGSLRQDANDVASATLGALLPHLAASDALPLLDHSTLVASDIGRLLSSYEQNALSGAVRTPVPVASEPEESKVNTILKRALTLLGTPYRWGGSSPESGLDCSGLVNYVFNTALGIELPRVSRDMARMSDAELIKDRGALRQGDLVFFGGKGRVNHVGIYVGEGRFLHAPSRGKDVRVDTLMSGYWGGKFMQARRLAI